MRCKAVINAQGFFLYDLAPGVKLKENQREVDHVNVAGLHKPRYDGNQWVEGASIEAVQAIERIAHAAVERAWRNRELDAADIKVNRLEDAGASALEWRAYRVLLCDMPQQDADPLKWKRPQAPK